MKFKSFALVAMLLATSIAKGDVITEWLSLTPVKLTAPALSDVKNVKGEVFSEAMPLTYNNIDIKVSPAEGGRIGNLIWETVSSQDTLTAAASDETMLRHYVSYIENVDYITGSITFDIFSNAEIYVDGQKVKSITDATADKKSTATVPVTFIPGKHTVMVKAVSKGGKTLAADFKADEKFAEEEIVFSTSPKRGKRVEDILNSKVFTQLSVSPSGKYAIVGINSTSEGKSTQTKAVYRVDNQTIVFNGTNAEDLQWIPGKDVVSFFISEGNGHTLYAYDIESGEQKTLISQHPSMSSCTWSPDRSYLIYYDTEDYHEKNWELRKLAAMEDRQYYYRSRFFACKYDFSTGMSSRITWGNLTTSVMDISRDGKKILFGTSHPDYSEFPFDKYSVYIMDVETQAVDTIWSEDKLFKNCTFSPDGKKLLVLGGPSAFGKMGEKVNKGQIVNQYDIQMFIYDLDSKETEAVSLDFDPTVIEAKWHNDGNIYLTVTEADFQNLYRYADGKFTKIESPASYINMYSIAENSDCILYSAMSPTHPFQIFKTDTAGGSTEEWLTPNKENFADVELGQLHDWDYTYKKTLIDGRYYLPANFDPEKKYPLIVYYYGGTTPVSRTFGGRWPFNLYTAHGYVVYVLQPSGAIGYGQEMAARHQNNWCKITADEIIAAVKAFAKEHSFIDAEHIGCMGASYGGFTTEYLTTQTDIFACAISHAGISSISSYWGEGYWGYGYSTNASGYSYPWNRRDIYVDQSPLFNADKVKVPLLLIHGTSDVNVPTGESIQLYTALKLLGKDVELVLVNGADHAVVKYEQRILWNNTILSYFDKYLKGKPAWWESNYKDLNL